MLYDSNNMKQSKVLIERSKLIKLAFLNFREIKKITFHKTFFIAKYLNIINNIDLEEYGKEI